MSRKNMVGILWGILSIIFAVAIYEMLRYFDLLDFQNVLSSVWVTVAFIVTIIIYNSGNLLSYLEGKDPLTGSVNSRALNQMQHRIQLLTELIKQQKFGSIAQHFDAKDISEQIQKWVITDAQQEIIEKLRTEAEKVSKDEWWDDLRGSTSFRLEMHISNLVRRGNVNLIIGASFALLGMIVLILLAFEKPEAIWDAQKFLLIKIPRFALAVGIEVLAFFFLNLYKVSGVEVRYFVNELSTFESKTMALEVAMRECPLVIPDAIKSLAASERNFILNKGETAIPIEKEKGSQDLSLTVSNIIEGLVSSGVLKKAGD